MAEEKPDLIMIKIMNLTHKLFAGTVLTYTQLARIQPLSSNITGMDIP